MSVAPRAGEDTIRTEDILATIAREGPALALVMLSGVQYYTGQKFDMKAITAAGRAAGAKVGWDLAHAVGNVRLRLSEWGADFAVWCSYKYLNSGAGGIGGAFVHARHHGAMPAHLQGWWSNRQDTRFEMREEVDAAPGAESFRLCNPPPWLAALNLASLEIFEEAGMDALLDKQVLLTGYLELLLNKRLHNALRIITPSDPEQRGCQLSLAFSCDLNQVIPARPGPPPTAGPPEDRAARRGLRRQAPQRNEDRPRPPLQLIHRRPQLCQHFAGSLGGRQVNKQELFWLMTFQPDL